MNLIRCGCPQCYGESNAVRDIIRRLESARRRDRRDLMAPLLEELKDAKESLRNVHNFVPPPG